MYGWLWRHLPFGRPGKIIGSLLLVGVVGALLWFKVFPAVEPLLPFDDVQVETDAETPDDPVPDDPVPAVPEDPSTSPTR